MNKSTYNKVTSEFYYYGKEVERALMDAVKEIGSASFRDPVHAPALDDDGYYQDVMIESIEWREDGYWVAIDETGQQWTDDDFLPCIHEKILDELVEQKQYSFKQ